MVGEAREEVGVQKELFWQDGAQDGREGAHQENAFRALDPGAAQKSYK